MITIKHGLCVLVVWATISLASARAETPPTKTTRYNLHQLVQIAEKNYPGVKAAKHALDAMKRDLYRAKWAWLPQGQLRGFVAPSPEVFCVDANGDRDATGAQCVSTTRELDAKDFNIAGIMARIELEVGMPLYTFDKIGSAKRAATAGVQAKQAQVYQATDELMLNVTKAYWGVKLAREFLHTIKTGREFLDQAIERIAKELDEGEGESTLTDLLRLKTHTAEIDSRTLQAKNLEKIALAGVSALTGMKNETFDIDPEPLSLVENKLSPFNEIFGLAQLHRPEIAMLAAAKRASQAQADLEKAKFFPDFLLVASVGAAYTSSADDPTHGFLYDPFNFAAAGFGLAMHWNLDTVQQYGRYKKAQSQGEEINAKQAEGLRGIELEIYKIYLDLKESMDRLKITEKGQKSARQWLVATSQNLEAGLCESKELTDSLVSFFLLRLQHLQAIFEVNVGWAKLAKAIGFSNSQQEGN
ncbi:MAG: TolC family protein [Pseudomonadota bacterium]